METANGGHNSKFDNCHFSFASCIIWIFSNVPVREKVLEQAKKDWPQFHQMDFSNTLENHSMAFQTLIHQHFGGFSFLKML